MNELSGPPRKHSSEHYQHFQKHFVVFDLMQSKRLKKTEKNEKELSGSPGKSRFVTILTLLQTLDVFRLDVVQKTKKTHENVKESSGSPGKKFIQNLTMTG